MRKQARFFASNEKFKMKSLQGLPGNLLWAHSFHFKRWVLVAEEQVSAHLTPSHPRSSLQIEGKSVASSSRQQYGTVPYINRVSSVKILGVVISSNLSVCGHLNNIITSSASYYVLLYWLRFANLLLKILCMYVCMYVCMYGIVFRQNRGIIHPNVV